MTTLVTLVRRVLGGEGVLRECRHCGTAVCEGRPDCPACGAEEIATYRLTRYQHD